MTALAMGVRELSIDEVGMVSGGVIEPTLPPIDSPDYIRILWDQIQEQDRSRFNLPPIH